MNDFKSVWKVIAANKAITATHVIQYCILKAMASKAEDKVAVAKHFIRKAFTPVSNSNKIANGHEPFRSLHRWANNASLKGRRWNGSGYDEFHHPVLGMEARELLSDDEIQLYSDIYDSLTPYSVVRRYSYFFTRQDIFPEYQLVQTAHVALELGSVIQEQVNDLYFTCIGVTDLRELESVEKLLKSLKLKYVAFREPDIGNEMTSIGVYPIKEHERGVLKGYKLLSFRKPSLNMEYDY